MSLVEQEIIEVYEALKEARDPPSSKHPLCTVETFHGTVNRDGSYHGLGYLSSCMQYQYTGEFSHGEIAGEGHIAWLNGYKVDGQFADGVPNGRGTITWPNGDTYEGDLVNGVRHGTGTLISHEGKAVYEGTWYRSSRHGKGTQRYTDGSVYTGDWKLGAREGMGMITYANGDCYEGEWFNNERHGKGSMGWKQGSSYYVEMYDGGWEHGLPHGKGVSTYIRPSVSKEASVDISTPLSYAPPVTSVINVYRGRFSKGAREGFGTFFYADGSAYEGQWANNKKNGRGKFVNCNGATFFCTYVDDAPQNLPNLVELSNASLVPEVYIEDIGGIPDGNVEQLSTTIKSLLLRFNTPLRGMFSSYANQENDVAFVFTPKTWWKHRLPYRINIPQFLRLLSDKGILQGLVTVATVIECIADVIEREFNVVMNYDYFDPSKDHKEELKAKVYRLTGSLNYRQFAETIIRLAPKVCVGPKYFSLGEKFCSLVVEQLIPNQFSVPLCSFSRRHYSIIQPLLPALEGKFNSLVEMHLESHSQLLEVRHFLLFIRSVLENINLGYTEAVATLFPSLQTMHSHQLPSGYNQPQSELSVTIFLKGCGDDNQKLISGVSVTKSLTIVDFVEALTILAVHMSEKEARSPEEILKEEVLTLEPVSFSSRL